jgi:hypothetical protein
MNHTHDISKVVFEVCLKAAIAMGDDLKGISWFARNHRRQDQRKAA